MSNYKVGDYVVHGHEVGQIIDILKDYQGMGDYYKIQSTLDVTLTVMTPMKRASQLLRPIIKKAEVEKLIDQMADVEALDPDYRNVESTYDELIKSGDHTDIIKLIKTSYARCSAKTSKGQPKNEKDKTFFRKAESLLYNEFAVALGMDYADTKQYVIDRVSQQAMVS